MLKNYSFYVFHLSPPCQFVINIDKKKNETCITGVKDERSYNSNKDKYFMSDFVGHLLGPLHVVMKKSI